MSHRNLSVEEQALSDMISELQKEVDSRLAKIGAFANEHGLSASIYHIGPLEESLYLANEQFLNNWGWEASDLESRGVEYGEWITSNQMEW